MSTKRVRKSRIQFLTLCWTVLHPDSAKANVIITGNIGEVAKNTEELAKSADGIEKNTDEIAKNMDEMTCSWSATSVTCISST